MSKVQLPMWDLLRRAGGLALAALAMALVAPTIASAATSFERVGAFNEAVPDGLPAHQYRIAVNHASGDVYLTDPVNDRVDVYAPNGTGADALTTLGSGAVIDPFGIAIDQSTGDVYVSDADDVVKFTTDGAPTPTFTLDVGFSSPEVTGPLAFDQVDHQLLVADKATNTIRRYDTDGTAGATFDGSAGAGSPGAFTGLQDLAVDSTGDVVVVDATGNPARNEGSVSRVERFAANGDWQATIGPVQQAATVGTRPADDTVIVSGDQNTVYSSGTPTLHLYSADGRALGQPAVDPSLQYATVTGIAADDGDDGQLLVATDTGDYLNGADQYGYGNISVQVYDPVAILAATTGAAASITATTATLNGSIDPKGLDTTYQFEYGTDTTYGSSTPESAPLGGTDGVQAASAALTGLNPGTTYHYRLVGTDADSSLQGADATFTTDALLPTISDALATATLSEARLAARVNPGWAPATYHFEYGPTTAYGTSTPERHLAAGGVPIDVVANISGLTAGTVYHARVVATNSVGTTATAGYSFTTTKVGQGDACSNAAIRAQQRSVFLPDCRAYEQVSPVEKNGPIFTQGGTSAASDDGGRLVFSSIASIGDSPSSPSRVTYQSKRTEDGWRSEGITPPHFADKFVANVGSYFTFSDDLHAGIVNNDRPNLTPSAPADATNLYVRDLVNGGYTLVTTAGPVGDPFYEPTFADASPDLRHVLFEAPAALTPDALAGVTNLYLSGPGGLTFVGILPDGTPAAGGSVSGSEAAPSTTVATSPKRNTVSPDGKRVVFSDLGTGQLYLRDLAAATPETSRVSAPASGVSDPNGTQAAKFQAATPSLSKIYFTSSEKLTDDASSGAASGGPELYEHDTATGALNDLSVDSNPADPNGAQVQGVFGVSDDGETVYFVASGQIEPGKGVAGAPNLYVATPAGTRFVLTLAPEDSAYWNPSVIPLNRAATPDGRHLIFHSSADLTSDRTAGTRQVYLYDLDADRVTCISCPRDGSTPSGDAATFDKFAGNGVVQKPPRAMVDSGRRAYFQTPDALVDGDTNGVADIYQYDDGVVSLISSGQGSTASRLLGMSADGSSVFFTTDDRLLPSDIDDLTDIYAARVGGGYTHQTEAAPCALDECQGPAPAPAQMPVAATVTFAGPGNASDQRAPLPASVSASSTKAVTGTSASVKVKVPAAGAISITGSTTRTARRSVSRAATYTVKVSLTAKAKATLTRKGVLKAKVKVAFTPKAGTASSKMLTVTFKRPKPSKRSRKVATKRVAAASTGSRS